MAGGYPSGNAGQTVTYLVVAGVLVALTLNSASITDRVLAQNQERGRMISELSEANRRLEASMAENAELHAQLVTQAREAGVVEERQRLAGEIHDTLAQGLTGIVAQLEAAEHTRHHADTWPRHVAQARALARANLTEARRSVRALRPEQLEQASLPEAIGTLARTWSEGSMIDADLETTGTVVRAGPDTEAAVFRATQEALSNMAKHAWVPRCSRPRPPSQPGRNGTPCSAGSLPCGLSCFSTKTGPPGRSRWSPSPGARTAHLAGEEGH